MTGSDSADDSADNLKLVEMADFTQLSKLASIRKVSSSWRKLSLSSIG